MSTHLTHHITVFRLHLIIPVLEPPSRSQGASDAPTNFTKEFGWNTILPVFCLEGFISQTAKGLPIDLMSHLCRELAATTLQQHLKELLLQGQYPVGITRR